MGASVWWATSTTRRPSTGVGRRRSARRCSAAWTRGWTLSRPSAPSPWQPGLRTCWRYPGPSRTGARSTPIDPLEGVDMPIVSQELEKELGYVARPFEAKHIREIFDKADPQMQEIALCLIQGKHLEVDRLVKADLERGTPATTILDDGLIAGMAVVGVKFRDNLIFVPEVLVPGRAMKAGMVPLSLSCRPRASSLWARW